MGNLTNFECEILGDFPEDKLNDEDMTILIYKLRNLFKKFSFKGGTFTIKTSNKCYGITSEDIYGEYSYKEREIINKIIDEKLNKGENK